jgi:hypothetical protein
MEFTILTNGGGKLSGKNITMIRIRGEVKSGILPDGTKIERRKMLWFEGLKTFVQCAPYDNHFLYTHKKGPGFMCTCGSFGITTGYKAYVKDASPSTGVDIIPGQLLSCFTHILTGKHADGSS